MPTEVFNKQDKVLNVHIGHPIAPKQYNEYKEVRQKLSYLRRRTYNLAHRDVKYKDEQLSESLEIKPVAPAKHKNILLDEYRSIPKEQFLHNTDKEQVFYAMAPQIPNLLYEIGRLRELTFREVEEGTGNDLDLDEYDQTYVHLIAWSKQNEEIIGSYRLGLADQILKENGVGLYTKTLFQLKPSFLKRISPAIELGRSFVAPAYQRSFSSLFLLWRGIGEFISYRPHYRYLFGPVSISNAYTHSSQMLMLRYLKLNHHNNKLARLVKPQNPSAKPKKVLNRQSHVIRQLRELEEMISDIELESAGIPVLIRQYLKLGAEFLAFNRDPLFSNVVDGLIVVDVHKTDRKILNKYMGREATKRYMDAQP
jgi:putative hemolysin